ncbi:hypothetical protein SAMN04487950_2265 [Halogranum rubrum]|uniref:Uncharacterized protein n=1 Tax=Halogranum rubrum TaxID=553466 RepID=A0A1I4ELX1_9EURY|nr:hypothetical protein SAMN04487950_2265 [Halogranum rubrum]
MSVACFTQDDASFLEGRSVSGDHGGQPTFSAGYHSLTPTSVLCARTVGIAVLLIHTSNSDWTVVEPSPQVASIEYIVVEPSRKEPGTQRLLFDGAGGADDLFLAELRTDEL